MKLSRQPSAGAATGDAYETVSYQLLEDGLPQDFHCLLFQSRIDSPVGIPGFGFVFPPSLGTVVGLKLETKRGAV